MSGSGETKGWARVTAPTRRLAGWSPADLRRWPGRSAAAVQLRADVIVPTVPNDLSGLVGGPDIHWDGLIAYIAVNRGWIDGVVVEGEDPTADPDLTSLLAALAEAGVPVRLLSDGMRPGVLVHAIAEQLVASVSVEVPTVADRMAEVKGRSDAADRLARSVETLVASGLDHDFRTRVGDDVGLLELPELAAGLRGGRLYALEPGGALGAVSDNEIAELRAAARACCVSLPTIVRDAG